MKKLVIALCLAAGLAAAGYAEDSKLYSSGKGSVFAKPDTVVIEAGATTEGVTAAACHAKNKAIMDAVLANLKKFGLEDKDIKTVNFSLNPKYNYDRALKKNLLDGYMLTHIFRVQHKDAKKAGELVDAIVSGGATNVNNIYFKVSDEDKYRAEARKLAVEDAKRMAKELAGNAGVTLTRILSIQESENPIQYPHFAQKAMLMAEDSGPAPVMEGETEITSSVSLVYEIK